MNSILTNKWTKVAVFLACLGPLGLLVWEGFHGGWGANPTQFVQHATGDWTLRFLAITLTISPLRKILSVMARNPARHRGLDAAISCHHADHLAAAEDSRPAAVDSLAPHAGTVCFLLCLPAFLHLSR